MTPDEVDNFAMERLVIRQAEDRDHHAIRELFRQGLLDGQVPENDTGADIDDLEAGYFADGGSSGFWVAACEDIVTGMIGVQRTAEDAAEIRRLRVCEVFRRRGIGTQLVEHAIGFCRSQGFLKVSLDVRIERSPAIALFEKFGFLPGRSRESGGRKTLDFYLDLYRRDRR